MQKYSKLHEIWNASCKSNRVGQFPDSCKAIFLNNQLLLCLKVVVTQVCGLVVLCVLTLDVNTIVSKNRMGLLKSPNHCCNVNTQDGVVTSPTLNIVSCFIMFINLYYNSFSYQPHVSERQAFIFVMLFFNAFLEKVSHPLIDTTSLLPAAVDIPVLFFHLSVCVAENAATHTQHSALAVTMT